MAFGPSAAAVWLARGCNPGAVWGESWSLPGLSLLSRSHPGALPGRSGHFPVTPAGVLGPSRLACGQSAVSAAGAGWPYERFGGTRHAGPVR